MRRLAIPLILLAGCGQHPPADEPAATAPPPPIHIVATERGPDGGMLVVIGESGDREGSLVAAPAGGVQVRDTAPAFSPDGRWVVFASSRGRALDESSLWAVAVGYDAAPVRLTDGTAIDMTPVWTPAGDAIVFASSRAGTFDLWRLGVETSGPALRPRGAAEPLTSAPGQELSPTVAPDGRIAYAALVTSDRRGGAADAAVTSTIEVRAPDGAITTLEPGPADSSPRFDPTGAVLAFTRPTVREGNARDPADATGTAAPFSSIDADLWVHDASGTRRVVDLPFTDESGPVWSADGQWMFATSVVRKPNGSPLFSSVIHVDLSAAPPVARMLIDRAGAVTRLSPGVAPVALDTGVLLRSPIYVDELRRILRDAIERNELGR
jgi:Tol biopolymer transport system component